MVGGTNQIIAIGVLSDIIVKDCEFGTILALYPHFLVTTSLQRRGDSAVGQLLVGALHVLWNCGGEFLDKAVGMGASQAVAATHLEGSCRKAVGDGGRTSIDVANETTVVRTGTIHRARKQAVGDGEVSGFHATHQTGCFHPACARACDGHIAPHLLKCRCPPRIGNDARGVKTRRTQRARNMQILDGRAIDFGKRRSHLITANFGIGYLQRMALAIKNAAECGSACAFALAANHRLVSAEVHVVSHDGIDSRSVVHNFGKRFPIVNRADEVIAIGVLLDCPCRCEGKHCNKRK